MKRVTTRHFVAFTSVALATLALAAASCMPSGTPTGGGSGGGNNGGVTSNGGSSNGIGGSSASVGGSSASVGGSTASVGGSSVSVGGSSASVGGSSASNGGSTSSVGGSTSSNGGTTSLGGSSDSSTRSGGSTSGSGGSSAAAGGTIASGGVTSNGGSSASTGGTTASNGGSTGVGTPKTTADIIGPGGATSGNTNGTHGDKWICLLNYPAAGENVTGAWFTYSWTTAACQTLTNPSGGGAPLCFKGGNCTGATPGAGLGFSLCDVHGVDTSTWPQMKNLITAGGLSTTAASTFSQCNAGAKITGVNWTLASGSIPAGMAVEFADVADQPLGSVASVAAGATSVSVPATFDASKIARVKFQINGTTIKTWDFCFQKLTLSYQ
jgi:hypothetical protein